MFVLIPFMPFYFNPRSREGSDTKSREIKRIGGVFQSTLPRRERLLAVTIGIKIFKFQSTLPRRERLNSCGADQETAAYFNPRSREGSDRCAVRVTPLYEHFNPRSREGSDVISAITGGGYLIFQSTLPRRERQFHFQADT